MTGSVEQQVELVYPDHYFRHNQAGVSDVVLFCLTRYSEDQSHGVRTVDRETYTVKTEGQPFVTPVGGTGVSTDSCPINWLALDFYTEQFTEEQFPEGDDVALGREAFLGVSNAILRFVGGEAPNPDINGWRGL